ncbi:hypothetical protein BAUCODRAFT_575591 [Baudoinia panamericana UAMH 10762]|uniref:Uncharacterized protein n=1 Tax=Baudoinia panamericana (strain UAMH 10762) TaxID=717646 RepID=M2NEC8_BAUPA|nr:uncharacterized protein BAUCODRAFT_575591 [Baudoinia panamericana UAMH 10762]EMC97579.1 hypothetical protein BAUCODRAFT_575591 [Baudoinia panamericana UAMH 10762]
MPSITVELGHVDIVQENAGHNLKLASSIDLNSVNECGITGVLDSRAIKHFLAARPWIYCANRFRLMINLLVDANLGPQTKEDLVDSFAARLQLAQVQLPKSIHVWRIKVVDLLSQIWRQLTLSAETVEVSPVDHLGSRTITVTLSHVDTEAAHVRQCPHKLGVGVPHHDIRPPEGILSYQLDSVRLTCHVRDDQVESLPPYQREREIDELGLEALLEDDNADCELLDWDNSVVPFHESAAGSDFDEVRADHLSFDGAVDCLLTRAELSDTHDLPDVPTLMKPAKPRNAPNLDRGDGGVGAILLLIDSAIRLAIAAKPRGLPKGMSVKRSRGFKCLANVAPAVWLPGYLPAVSRRAHFLPTISHAILGVTSRDADRKDFALSTAQLAKHSNIHAVQGTISPSQMLWLMLQQNVLASNAARLFSVCAQQPAHRDKTEVEIRPILKSTCSLEESLQGGYEAGVNEDASARGIETLWGGLDVCHSSSPPLMPYGLADELAGEIKW